ncbi:MAG: tyrosine-type recombinase/integrase, partial [Chloroflexia bacterium]|nr:tyrosine-type recombinase/integrase [Chloroflexia bacterium]
DWQAVERLLAGDLWREHDLIFSSTVGTPYQPANLHKRWHAHLKRAGLDPVPFHSLRHTAASFLVALNVHPRIAMEMLGHTNIQTTMQIYSHAQSDDMRRAMESVEHVLRQASGSDF